MINKLKILAYDYAVRIREGLAIEHEALATNNSFTREITVDSISAKHNPEAEIFHEIVEALNAELELNMEHRVITALSSVLAAVLKDNPEFTWMFLKRPTVISETDNNTIFNVSTRIQ